MNVFITGGTGFVGSAVIGELLAAGHQVSGLARSEDAARKLSEAGVTPVRGELVDKEIIKAAARAADAVIQCAFIHDFSKHAEAARIDLEACEAIIDGLVGSAGKKVFVCTSGTATLPHGRSTTERDEHDAKSETSARVPAEKVVFAAAKRGVKSAVLRLPPSVHGAGDHGFVPMLMDLAKKKGTSAYIGDGNNRWPAVHREDAALLYRLAIEKLADGSVPAGSVLHAVADNGVPFKEIAQAIADQLKLGPAVSRPAEHFDWFARFARLDNPTTSDITRAQTGWRPTRAGLIEDLRSDAYTRR